MEHSKSVGLRLGTLGIFFASVIFTSCSMPKTNVDLVITNGIFCTLDERMPEAQAVAIKDGRIAAVGTNIGIRLELCRGKRPLIFTVRLFFPD